MDDAHICPSHGEYRRAQHQYSAPVCPDCNDEANAQESEFRAQWYRYVHWDQWSGVPARYRAATVDGIQPVTRSAVALRTAAGTYLQIGWADGRGLVLLGMPGTGKTLAACAIVNAACAGGTAAKYASWPDVLAEIKNAFNGPKDAPGRTLLDRLAACPLLALDELGVRQQSDFDHGQLFELIDYRYREVLPTVVCSNAVRSDFAKAVGDRVADRLRETGAIVTLSGESQRGRLTCSGPDALQPPSERLTTRRHVGGFWESREVTA